MHLSRNPARSAIEYLTKAQPDRPVLFFNPAELRATLRRFQRGFPGMVTYAVKANDSPEVLETLCLSGLGAFDVASPVEMTRVRAVCPSAVLHYNNPVRSRFEIGQGVALGVASWAVDCPSELDKLIAGGARGEVSVRLRLPVKGAAYDFGAKFGADPAQAADLLRSVSLAGFSVAMTFHPGTQCNNPAAWQAYIQACADVSVRAGVPLARLNVGGGFAAHRLGAAPDLDAIFRAIDTTATQVFGTRRPALICEPGRAMVAESYQLAVRVKAIRSGAIVYLNDGIYGGMTEWRDLGQTDRVTVVSPTGAVRRGASKPFTLFGPTCDSLDRIPGQIRLPSDMQEEDYILCDGMGAYSTATATGFNGYGNLCRVTLNL